MIHIDRSRRAQAWAKVAAQGKALLARGHWVIKFPEGTRTARDAHVQGRRDAAGGGHRRAGGADRRDLGALLAAQEPVAAAGGDRDFDRHPDRVRCQPDALMREVQSWIEAEMRRLDPDAYAQAA